MSSATDSDKIKNRDSWLKTGVISFFVIITGWKLLTSPISINLTEIKLNDVLALVLSVFAISLSVAFYFKATDTSNLFYDNTYKFTKDISEILGRIEAGFGERLRHLDEGYTGLRDKVERFPNLDPEKAAKKVKEEEEEVKKKEQERNQLIEELAKKAKLQESEKNKLFLELRQKDEELLDAKRQLRFFERRLSRAEIPRVEQPIIRESIESPITISPRLLEFIQRRLLDELGRETVLEAPTDFINRRFRAIRDELPKGILEELNDARLLDPRGLFNKDAIRILKNLAR